MPPLHGPTQPPATGPFISGQVAFALTLEQRRADSPGGSGLPNKLPSFPTRGRDWHNGITLVAPELGGSGSEKGCAVGLGRAPRKRRASGGASVLDGPSLPACWCAHLRIPSPFGGEPDAVTCFGDQNVPQ